MLIILPSLYNLMLVIISSPSCMSMPEWTAIQITRNSHSSMEDLKVLLKVIVVAQETVTSLQHLQIALKSNITLATV